MALIETDMLGHTRDKVQRAVDILKMFEPQDGYYQAYSGGKDSIVLDKIMELSGVKRDKHYNVTTVDPPELVRFIISQHDTVIYDMPDGSHKYYAANCGKKLLVRITEDDVSGRVIHFTIPAIPMRKLIVKKQMPPTRLQRYCCEVLKETSGEGRVTVTGVRKYESANRARNQGEALIFNGRAGQKAAEEVGAHFIKTVHGGVILNYDDSNSRRVVEQCYRNYKTLVNPIIDFTDEDVWEFIRKYKLPYCSLYDEGFKRLGCIGCPMGGFASQKREFQRWPQYQRLYIKAFDEMLLARKAAGKLNRNRLWVDGKGMFDWWLGKDNGYNKDQITIDEFMGDNFR